MHPQDLKKSAIENNIKNIQKRIQELEQSFDSVNRDLSVEEEPAVQDYPALMPREAVHNDKSFSRARSEVAELRSNFKRVSKRREEDEVSQIADNFETRKMIEGLLREIDILRENEKQADVRVETLTFRCEKLQTELTVKLDTNNKLLMEIEDKNGQIKNLLAQIKSLETVIDQNKRSVLPDFQRLKGQHDIALLEIRSLENDNVILENRIKDLTDANAQVRDEKREVDARNRQIEIERLTLKKEIEELKASFMNHENDMEDLNEKYERVILENERLKNEVLYLNQRNKIQAAEADMPEESSLNYDASRGGRGEFSGILARGRSEKRAKEATLTETVFKGELDKRPLKPVDRTTRDGIAGGATMGNRLVTNETERLNFDQLQLIEERMKKLNR